MIQHVSPQMLQDVLSDDFKMGEEGYTRKFSKNGEQGLVACIQSVHWLYTAPTGCNMVPDAHGHHHEIVPHGEDLVKS